MLQYILLHLASGIKIRDSHHHKNLQKIPEWSLLPFRRLFQEKPEPSCLQDVKAVKIEAIFFQVHGGLQKKAIRRRTAQLK